MVSVSQPEPVSTIALNCQESALTLPETATATLYATFTPPHTPASFIAIAQNVANIVSRDFGTERTAEIRVEFAADPVSSRSSEIEDALRKAAGSPIPFGPSTGTSDMRHFVERQVPCVLFGPGRGYNPHRANEYFELSSLSEMTDLLSSTVLSWCN
jgi:acetylornithine deacetylase/succinyl-diaminopimelate desuccinylase-like protein